MIVDLLQPIRDKSADRFSDGLMTKKDYLALDRELENKRNFFLVCVN